MTPKKIIIDTDPGVDDILALLLALSSSPEDLDLLLISVTFGNVDVQNCLRNVVSLFHVIEKERAWRRQQGRPEGFEILQGSKPIVAVGADKPLLDEMMTADFFHGKDGLGGVHESHPHLTPSATWSSLFTAGQTSDTLSTTTVTSPSELERTEAEHTTFIPSTLPAHKQILKTLAENEADTVTIVAIGPLANLALAAAEDVETFLRVKGVVYMGGAVGVPGNMSPLAEFNIHSDPLAAARVFALTSPDPASTMPPSTSPATALPPYATHLSKQLKLSLLPLDITQKHMLHRSDFDKAVKPLLAGATPSPLATWVSAFLKPVFGRFGGGEAMALHDPLAVWFALTSRTPTSTTSSAIASAYSASDNSGDKLGEPKPETHWQTQKEVDIRVESSGQWTRGALIVDKRGREKKQGGSKGDAGGWLDSEKGNRIDLVISSGVEEGLGEMMLKTVFGS